MMNPMTVRINPKNEHDLYQFVKSKGGIKKAINYLFGHYQMTKDIQSLIGDIVDKPPAIKQPTPVDDEVFNMANNFIK